MPARLRFCLSAVLLLLCALAGARGAHAQRFSLEADRVQMAELKGLWRFHTGDDPHWADPAFNDSAWPLLKSDQPWSTQGYPGYSGFAWYRFQVDLPPHTGPLALYIPTLYTSYQVFANGRLVGQFGGLPPHAFVPQGPGYAVTIPADLLAPGQPLQIAIRVWHWREWAPYEGGGPHVPVRLGTLGLISEWATLRHSDTFWYLSSNNIQLLIALLATFASLGFFALHPVDREYLWFGLYELALATVALIVDYQVLVIHALKPWEILSLCVGALSSVFVLTFAATILRQPRGLLYWIAIASIASTLLMLIPGERGWISVPVFSLFLTLGSLPGQIITLVFLLRASRTRIPGAISLTIPVGLYYLEGLFGGVLWIYESAGHPHFRERRFHWFYNLSNTPFPFSVDDVVALVVQLAILGVLILRFAHTRRDEQRLASELEAARAVQHVLIPEQIPAIPGLRIDAVYKPAGEVGGDFFQILPLPAGGVLVAIGDVSGKGTPAAMTVSLLVGMLGSLTRFVHTPAALLAALNDGLVTRSAGGFTTCLLARLDPDGTVTFSNAGHLAPYLAGAEVPLDPGLPLGLTPGSTYTETCLHLPEAGQLTLITDGVVEARSPEGALLGFDRAATLSAQPAQAIAEAAQHFGQEDDITVLQLTRQTDARTPPVSVNTPALTPAPL